MPVKKGVINKNDVSDLKDFASEINQYLENQTPKA